jgi:hypothetical protein
VVHSWSHSMLNAESGERWDAARACRSSCPLMMSGLGWRLGTGVRLMVALVGMDIPIGRRVGDEDAWITMWVELGEFGALLPDIVI